MGNTIKTTLLLALLTALLVALGRVFGGRGGMVLAFGMAIVMNVGSYWFSDRIVLAMYRARELGPGEHPELHRMVANIAQTGGLPMPRLFVVPQPGLNAFATGRGPEHAVVAVTEGLLAHLDGPELEGVLAHELAHVKNRDILVSAVAATLAGAIMLIADMARWASIFGGFGGRDSEERGNPLALLVAAIVAPLAALLVQMAISRSREYLADATGARLAGSPEGLARALAKLAAAGRIVPTEGPAAASHVLIVSPLSGGGLFSLFSTHPPIEERIKRLRALAPGA
ncbi:MAG TPA: zinc metalloprotease HtpX [bacterium]